MASGSVAIAHGPLTCHSILASHRELMGLPSLYSNAWWTCKVQINPGSSCPKWRGRCGKEKSWASPSGSPNSQECLSRPFTSWVTREINRSLRTAQLSPQADFNSWDNGHFWLYLFVGFLFPEPDIGGFRSTSLKIPELQVLHMVWEKMPKSGWSTVIKLTPSKHKEKARGKEPSLVSPACSWGNYVLKTGTLPPTRLPSLFEHLLVYFLFTYNTYEGENLIWSLAKLVLPSSQKEPGMRAVLKKQTSEWMGDLVWWLRALATLAADRDLVSSTHMVDQKHL